jgi:hypothetical protein
MKKNKLAEAIEVLIEHEFLNTLVQISSNHLTQVLVILVQMSSSSEKLHFA